jgi:hypothetical protein
MDEEIRKDAKERNADQPWRAGGQRKPVPPAVPTVCAARQK